MGKSNLLVKGFLSLAVCFLLLGISASVYASWGCVGDCPEKLSTLAGGPEPGCSAGSCDSAYLYYCEDKETGVSLVCRDFHNFVPIIARWECKCQTPVPPPEP